MLVLYFQYDDHQYTVLVLYFQYDDHQYYESHVVTGAASSELWVDMVDMGKNTHGSLSNSHRTAAVSVASSYRTTVSGIQTCAVHS